MSRLGPFAWGEAHRVEALRNQRFFAIGGKRFAVMFVWRKR